MSFPSLSGRHVAEEDVCKVVHAVPDSKEAEEHEEVINFDDNCNDIQINFEITQNAFNGTCFDNGAQSSVIGKMQSLVYCEFNGQPVMLTPLLSLLFGHLALA